MYSVHLSYETWESYDTPCTPCRNYCCRKKRTNTTTEIIVFVVRLSCFCSPPLRFTTTSTCGNQSLTIRILTSNCSASKIDETVDVTRWLAGCNDRFGSNILGDISNGIQLLPTAIGLATVSTDF